MLVYIFIVMCVATLLLLQANRLLRRIAEGVERQAAEVELLPWHVPEIAQHPDESDAEYKARALRWLASQRSDLH